MIKKTIKKVIELFNKNVADGLHNNGYWVRQISLRSLQNNLENCKKKYHELCTNKVVEMLKSYNKSAIQGIKKYADKYKEWHEN